MNVWSSEREFARQTDVCHSVQKNVMKTDKEIIYAFIDSQNLNLSILHAGWKLDFKRLRIFLERKYHVAKIFLFIGYVMGNEMLYTSLQNMGYVVVFKPTLQNKDGVVKGNCDAELVLHCMIEYDNFDQAIVVSGDGDFHCLVEYLLAQNKFFKLGIPNKRSFSALLKKFQNRCFYVSDLRHKLEYYKNDRG